MTLVFYSQLIFLLLIIIISCTIEGNLNRDRRQTIDSPNRNVGVPQQKLDGSMPVNNVPFNPTNSLNIPPSNERNNQKPLNSNNYLIGASSPQLQPSPSRGFYNSPAFQPPPFSGEKPSGWFGTSHNNWVSSRDSEVDKNKLGAEKSISQNNPQTKTVQPRREDGGPYFLAKVAKQYASKGVKAFNFGQFETREGRGSLCMNNDNFDGYVFGQFPCPLPKSTGMNQLDQYCCGYANYQYCCNAQEFSQSQRGALADHNYINEQRFPRQSTYPSSMRRRLAIILPIASFIVLTGMGILVFLYYKKFRKEQNRTRKPSGAIRLEDTYSIVPQEQPVEKLTTTLDDSE